MAKPSEKPEFKKSGEVWTNVDYLASIARSLSRLVAVTCGVSRDIVLDPSNTIEQLEQVAERVATENYRHHKPESDTMAQWDGKRKTAASFLAEPPPVVE